MPAELPQESPKKQTTQLGLDFDLPTGSDGQVPSAASTKADGAKVQADIPTQPGVSGHEIEKGDEGHSVATTPSRSRADVRLCPKQSRSGSWGYVDERGDWGIVPTLEAAEPFCDGRAKAKRKGVWGIIDTRGAWLEPPEFRKRRPARPSRPWTPHKSLDGLTPFKRNGLWGLESAAGAVVLEPQFSKLWGFSGTTAKAIREGKQYKIIVTDTRVIVSDGPPISKETLRAFRAESKLTPHPHQERSSAYHRGGKRRHHDEC